MNSSSPGQRAVRRARQIIEATSLDLRGLSVYTEAATGSYCVTPVLAALSGARRVFALAQDSRFGLAAQALSATAAFAEQAGVMDRIVLVAEKRGADVECADIVTNSGHVRPIDTEMVAWMKPSAVVSLMYEPWEFRPQDVDLDACRAKGIAVAGTDESHAVAGVMDYLGMMALKLLLDGGIEVVGSHAVVWSNNKFCGYIARTLASVGARVSAICGLELWGDIDAAASTIHYLGGADHAWPHLPQIRGADVILLAMSPSKTIWIGTTEEAVIAADVLAAVAPGVCIAQFCGAVDRQALLALGLQALPAEEPAPQHMGVLPSSLGVVPVLRLQAGGLKVGEVLARSRLTGASCEAAVAQAIASGYALGLTG